MHPHPPQLLPMSLQRSIACTVPPSYTIDRGSQVPMPYPLLATFPCVVEPPTHPLPPLCTPSHMCKYHQQEANFHSCPPLCCGASSLGS